MKLAITLEVDVDSAGWLAEYGVDADRLLSDVLSYVSTLVAGSYAADEAGVLTLGGSWAERRHA